MGTEATAIPPATARLWPLAKVLWREGWRYFVVSVLALAVDFGLLVALTEAAGAHYLVSGAVGFLAGLCVAYLLSVRFVFRERRLNSRGLELAGFMAIGLAGLLLNEGLLALFVEQLGLGYALAKVPATGVGFLFNFGARRVLLFTRPAQS